jgi:hypothetical protein
MKAIIYLIILQVFALTLKAQYEGPVPPIGSGFGSDGPFSVSVNKIVNDHWLLNNIYVFYPEGTTNPVPTIFYSHGYGGNDTTYQIELLKHVASKGTTIVFVPYKTVGVDVAERYATLYDGFIKAARSLPTIIDTTRVGFFGHSFGGGATPGIAFKAFTENNWGANGRFIFCSAPWYSYELGTSSLDNFPADCKMITTLYDDDTVNDHRLGMDIFNRIAIDDSIKDCIIAYTDTISDYIYEANHNLPGQNTPESEYDALDYYVIFRLLDALADYTFTGNLEAKNIALGNASIEQRNMGSKLKPLVVKNNPSPVYPQSKYKWPCDSLINERREYCQDLSDVTEPNEDLEIFIYPNPTDGFVHLNIEEQIIKNIKLYNIHNKLMGEYFSNEFSVSGFPDGVYIIQIETDKSIAVRKLLKQ